MDVAKKIRRAAEPFSLSAAAAKEQTPGSIFLLPPALRVLPRSDEEKGNVWVVRGEIAEVLLLAGTAASEESVRTAIEQLRNFLPGIISGKFCLQEILAINEYHETHRDSIDVVATKPAENLLATSTEFTANEQRLQQMTRSTWRLPFKNTVTPISRAAIKEEFRRLDLKGEGRLTMMYLRSALELREVRESEQVIREWFRENDKGEKGYIDFKDYEAIYESVMDHAPKKLSSKSLTFSDVEGNRLGGASLSMSASATATSPSQRKRAAAEERLALLKKVFDKHDVDGDGLISMEDLKNAYTAQGKAFTTPDLRTWVQSRDLSGTGAVCFEDFVKHYK